MLFAIKIYDIENSASLRDKYRQQHLDYIASFEDQTLFAGPILSADLSIELGSHRLIDLPDLAAAHQHVAEEPYVIGGVQYGAEIYRWKTALPYSWRDCPRVKGHVQYLMHAIEDADNVGLRDQLQQEQDVYNESSGGCCIARGSLLNASGEKAIGDLAIVDVADLASAISYWENQPFVKHGLYEKVEFYGWRFGRVFDQFNKKA
jgi:uncharacterized protein YciI